jgi:hypothetical protein
MFSRRNARLNADRSKLPYQSQGMFFVSWQYLGNKFCVNQTTMELAILLIRNQRHRSELVPNGHFFQN